MRTKNTDLPETPAEVERLAGIASSRLVVLWRKVFGPQTPKPHGPCKYCGNDTNEVNAFAEMMGMDKQFRHEWCLMQEMERRDIEREERKKIDLIKTAIRELEAENTQAVATASPAHQSHDQTL